MSVELKPCPFCNGEAKYSEAFNRNYVECRNTGCWFQGVMASPSEWNTRTASEQPVEYTAFTEALKEWGSPDDKFGQYHCDSGNLYALWGRAVAWATKRESVGWQPIETAPRDGTYVLCCWTTKDAGYDKVGLAFSNSIGAWDIGWWCCPTPTYWMPLPDAPKVNSIEDGK